MTRPLAAVAAAVLLLAPSAAAQDMPLSQIVIEGEGWVKQHDQQPLRRTQPGRDVAVTSPDQTTEFTWQRGQHFIYARPLPKGPSSPYAPLRVPAGIDPQSARSPPTATAASTRPPPSACRCSTRRAGCAASSTRRRPGPGSTCCGSRATGSWSRWVAPRYARKLRTAGANR